MREIFSGLPASPGIGIGAIFVYRPTLETSPTSPESTQAESAHQAQQEWERFLHAHARVDADLEELIQSSQPLIADIFSSQRLILHDKTLLDAVRASIYEAGNDAVTATQEFIQNTEAVFQAMEDEYFASRSADVLDVGQKLLAHLQTAPTPSELHNLPPDTILLAEKLTPSELFELSQEKVRAIGLVQGTPTAHIAILARTLEYPLVCALNPTVLTAVGQGDMAIVDGNLGQLVLDPSAEDVEHYTNSRTYLQEQRKAAAADALLPAITLDGHCIPICANANGTQEVVQAFDHGADSIGLLRTEFLYLDCDSPPDAAEQQQLLAGVVTLFESYIDQRFGPLTIHSAGSQHTASRHRNMDMIAPPLTVRLLDIGGDKPYPFLEAQETESNPFLGLRGIRLLLKNQTLLRTQLQAVVRTAIDSRTRLRLMVPMVTTLDELRSVRKVLDEVIATECQGQAYQAEIQLGVLVEVPAVALLIEHFAEEVDFLSIGTNDLTQYAMASDRTNSTVATLADPLHPAVLQMIRTICDAGHRYGISVSICGEIASDPTAVPLLIGLGSTELSVAPPAVPLVKQSVRQCDLMRCRQLADLCLRCTSAEAVRDLLANEQLPTDAPTLAQADAAAPSLCDDPDTSQATQHE